VTTVYLVRHAVHSAVDHVLVGRNQQTGLSSDGFWQAGRLAEYFANLGIARIHSSPQLRARQTASSIASAAGIPFVVVPEMDELDTGEWTGRSFAELENDARWRQWNCDRGTARIPQGESMSEVRERVFRHLAHVANSYVNRQVVIVTHAEIIRVAILEFRGLALQDYFKVRVDPASVTTLRLGKHGGEVVRENAPCDVLVAA